MSLQELGMFELSVLGVYRVKWTRLCLRVMTFSALYSRPIAIREVYQSNSASLVSTARRSAYGCFSLIGVLSSDITTRVHAAFTCFESIRNDVSRMCCGTTKQLITTPTHVHGS